MAPFRLAVPCRTGSRPTPWPCPPKCSCRSQAAHGFQRDMPSHLGVRVALEYVFYGPLGGSALPKQGGVVTRWQPKTASREGVPHVELAAASGAAAHGCGRRVKDTAN